jgi:hypothetical protein
MEFASINKFDTISHVLFFVVLYIATIRLINPVIGSCNNGAIFLPSLTLVIHIQILVVWLLSLHNDHHHIYGMTYFNKSAGRFSDGRLIIDFIGNFS